MISKDQVNRRNIYTGKVNCFWSIMNILKRDSNYQNNCYERTLEVWGYENTTYLLKKLKSFKHNTIMYCSFSYQEIYFIMLLGIKRKQISFFAHTFRNIFFLIVTVIITERFNIHFSRITWPVTWSFLPGCTPIFINASLLYCWNWAIIP